MNGIIEATSIYYYAPHAGTKYYIVILEELMYMSLMSNSIVYSLDIYFIFLPIVIPNSIVFYYSSANDNRTSPGWIPLASFML